MTTPRRVALCGLAFVLAVGGPAAAQDDPVLGVTPPPPPPRRAAAAVEPAAGNLGLLFNLNNVFTVGPVLGGWQGFGFGAQYDLSPGLVARAGLDLVRQTDGADVVKTTQITGSDVVVTYEVLPPASGWTSVHGASLAFDVLKLVGRKPIAPYLGAGLYGSYQRLSLDYTDDLSVTDQITEIDDAVNALTAGLRGVLGVRWRLNERFAFFAEYHLRVDGVSWQSVREQTTVNNTASGVPASSQTTVEFEETRFFNFDLALGQGGALGLVAYF